MEYYNYSDLLAAAIAPNANRCTIDSLGRWFENYGSRYWNGECYDADGKNLWPIYQKAEEDDYEIVGYTWDHAESMSSLES